MEIESVPRLTFKNILYATDFSASSEAALPFAKALAREFEATVFVTHVYPYEFPLDDAPGLANTRLGAEQRMSAFLRDQEFKGVPYQVVLQAGDVWVAISELVKQHEIDLIVTGTRGRGTIKDLLLGSVAEAIVRCSPCPVLTVGPHVSPQVAGEFRRILLATDFSAGSESATSYAVWLAEKSNAHLILLHAIETPAKSEVRMDAAAGVALPHSPELRIARQQLRNLLPPAGRVKEDAELRVEFGAPSEAILRIAGEGPADLIVMGARRSRMPYVSAHAPWHTLHQVIGKAHCPVLTVRA